MACRIERFHFPFYGFERADLNGSEIENRKSASASLLQHQKTRITVVRATTWHRVERLATSVKCTSHIALRSPNT